MANIQTLPLEDLGMTQALLDPCLFFKQEKKELIGMIATLVDDSLGFGNPSFATLEETKVKSFDDKPREESFPITFGGSIIDCVDSTRKVHRKEYADSLKTLSPSMFTQEEFTHGRG